MGDGVRYLTEMVARVVARNNPEDSNDVNWFAAERVALNFCKMNLLSDGEVRSHIASLPGSDAVKMSYVFDGVL